MNKLNQILTGLDQKALDEIKGSILDTNRRLLAAYSMPALLVLLALIANSFLSDTLLFARIPYCCCALGILIIIVIELLFSKKNPKLVSVGVHLFICVLFAFGMSMGLCDAPDAPTTAFIVILFAVPMVFLVNPIQMGIMISAAALLYLIFDHQVKYPPAFYVDLINILSFLVMSLVSSTIILRTKIREVWLELENKRISETDQLTGIYNRRKFETDLHLLEEVRKEKNIAIIVMDINGMKKANDTRGHAAGDELIKGAASCLKEAIGELGNCYRTGGDEFMAILEDCPYIPVQLTAMVKNHTESWKGSLAESLSVSCGAILSTEVNVNSMEELVNAADGAMYADKAAYYKLHDRRKHS